MSVIFKTQDGGNSENLNKLILNKIIVPCDIYRSHPSYYKLKAARIFSTPRVLIVTKNLESLIITYLVRLFEFFVCDTNKNNNIL